MAANLYTMCFALIALATKFNAHVGVVHMLIPAFPWIRTHRDGLMIGWCALVLGGIFIAGVIDTCVRLTSAMVSLANCDEVAVQAGFARYVVPNPEPPQAPAAHAPSPMATPRRSARLAKQA